MFSSFQSSDPNGLLQSGISSKFSNRKKSKKMEMRRSQDISIGQDLTRSLRFLSVRRFELLNLISRQSDQFDRIGSLMSNCDKLMSSLNEEDDGVVLARIRDGEKDARRLGFGMLCSSSYGIEMMENGDCQKCDSTQVVPEQLLQVSSPPSNKGEEEISAVSCSCANLSSETDYVDDAITEYLTFVNPNSCCEKLENLLIHGLLDGQFEPKEEKSKQQFWLHPLHHLSLSAYTTLASAYKTSASYLLALNPEMDERQLEAFDMSRTSAAYSLMLAGKSLLNVARSCVWKLLAKQGLTVAELSHFPAVEESIKVANDVENESLLADDLVKRVSTDCRLTNTTVPSGLGSGNATLFPKIES
ncbi:unnamed protein product [Camellia sinensis]